jgi:hypothetical protein
MKISLTVDFNDTVYNMCKYIIMVDAQCIDQKVGRFLLGRQTGHTSVMVSVANKLHKSGYRVVCVTSEQGRRLLERCSGGNGVLCKVISYSNFNRNALRGDYEYDIIIFDECENNKSQLSEGALDYTMSRSNHNIQNGFKSTAFFFLQ